MFCTACYVDVLSYVFRAYTVTMGKVARAGSLFSSKLDGNGKHWHSCILQWLKDSACYTRLCLQEVSIPFALVDISLSMNPIQKKGSPGLLISKLVSDVCAAQVGGWPTDCVGGAEAPSHPASCLLHGCVICPGYPPSFPIKFNHAGLLQVWLASHPLPFNLLSHIQ